jgi:hypothetical protein
MPIELLVGGLEALAAQPSPSGAAQPRNVTIDT